MSEQKRLLVAIPDSLTALGGISRPTLYEKVNSGDLVKVNIGRRSFITAESLDAYVNRLSEQAQASA